MQVNKPKRRSHQRDVIYQELVKSESHPTAVELYQDVRKVLPRVSLGTVYRNLEQLAKSGLINKIANGNSVRFDAEMDKHKHIRCVVCDEIADVHGISEDSLSVSHNELSGFKVVGCNVEFLGICPKCQEKN